MISVAFGLAALLWPPLLPLDSEGPAPYIRGIRVSIALLFGYGFLRLGSYLGWRSKGVML